MVDRRRELDAPSLGRIVLRTVHSSSLVPLMEAMRGPVFR
jgi:hypothetical protein